MLSERVMGKWEKETGDKYFQPFINLKNPETLYPVPWLNEVGYSKVEPVVTVMSLSFPLR